MDWHKTLKRAFGPDRVVLVCTGTDEGADQEWRAAPFSWIMPVSYDPPVVTLATYREGTTEIRCRERAPVVFSFPGIGLAQPVLWAGAQRGLVARDVAQLMLGRTRWDWQGVHGVGACRFHLVGWVMERLEIANRVLIFVECHGEVGELEQVDDPLIHLGGERFGFLSHRFSVVRYGKGPPPEVVAKG